MNASGSTEREATALDSPSDSAQPRLSRRGGRRRGRDLLSGRVRCGLCNRVAGVDYNERGQAIYKCRHRGKGCRLSSRSANGLHRAALLGLQLLATEGELQDAIQAELRGQTPTSPPRTQATRAGLVGSLTQKRRKLLDLHYADKITAETFADEERRLTGPLSTPGRRASDRAGTRAQKPSRRTVRGRRPTTPRAERRHTVARSNASRTKSLDRRPGRGRRHQTPSGSAPDPATRSGWRRRSDHRRTRPRSSGR